MSDTEATTEATEDDRRIIRKFNDDDEAPLVEDEDERDHAETLPGQEAYVPLPEGSFTDDSEPAPGTTVSELIEGSEPSADVVHRPRTVRRTRDGIKLMLTEIGDGTFVGWEKCATCQLAVAGCSCSGGPVPAAWVLRARDKRFERETRGRVERHLREKLVDNKALSFLEIAEIAALRVTNPLVELADALDQAVDDVRNYRGDYLAVLEGIAAALRAEPDAEQVKALAVSLEQTDRSVLRANLGLKPVKTGLPDVDMTGSVPPEQMDAFIEATNPDFFDDTQEQQA